MFILLKISWRNLWRNMRRTVIILVSVFVGVWGMVVAMGYTNGFLDSMIEMAIKSHIGHIEIHAKGYQQDPQIKLALENPDEIMSTLERIPGVVHKAKRVKSMAMMTTARNISGGMILGIQPEKEAHITMIAESMSKGEYLEADDNRGIILGSKLAEKLDVEPGDKLVLQAQGYDGAVQAVGLRVRGIFETGTESIDKYFACMNIEAAQEMLAMGKRVTEVVIIGDDAYHLDSLQQTIASSLSGMEPDLEILTWGEVMPELKQWLALADVGNYIFLVIIYIAMAFGIANTMIMAIFERIRELGILKALGTTPYQVFMLIMIEAVILCMLGVAIGLGVSYFTVFYFQVHGLDQSFLSEALSSLGAASVIYPRLSFENVWVSAVLALVMAVAASLYPAFKAARLRPMEAIRFV